MKYIITESQYNKAIDKFISSQFNNFEKKKNRKYRDSIFWVKNGEVIAEIKGSDFFYIKGDLWDLISKLFSLNDDEVKSSIKSWLDEHYDLGELTPSSLYFLRGNGLF